MNNFTIEAGMKFDAQNRIFDQSDFQIIASMTGAMGSGETRSFDSMPKCNGRYVKIQQFQRSSLVLCEVQVYGIGKI